MTNQYVCEHSNECGDGDLDFGEECDDDDLTNGDGCSATCQIEDCWSCSGAPSTCTPLTNGAACTDDSNPCTVDSCKEKTLLLAAMKNTEAGPASPDLDYLRYQIKPGPESVQPAGPDGSYPKPPKHIKRIWQLNNQFGTVNVLSKKAVALLVPARSDLNASPADPGDTTHYNCYQVAATKDITDQTPNAGDDTGKFRPDLQAFFEEGLFDDCALLADAMTASFAMTAVEGTCLIDLKKPVELCNPADKSAVQPPRQTMATISGSTARTQQSLLCYKAELAKKFNSAAAAALANGTVGAPLEPKQAKHVKHGVKTNDPVLTTAGNQFPAPLLLDTTGLARVCIPTQVLGMSEAP